LTVVKKGMDLEISAE